MSHLKLIKRTLQLSFILSLLFTIDLSVNPASAKQSNQKNKKAVDQKPIKLTAAQLAVVAGKYQYLDDYVTITPDHGDIVLKQLQGQRKSIRFYPTNLHEFSTRQFGKPYWIIFSGSVKGKARSFVSLDHDIWVRAK
jgi:hypothetical protein